MAFLELIVTTACTIYIIALMTVTKNTTRFPGAVWCSTHGWSRHSTANCKGISGKGQEGRKPRCYACGSEEHKIWQCPKAKKCYNCGGRGHESWECDKPKDRDKIVAGIRAASANRRDNNEPTPIHDQDKLSIKITSTNGEIKDKIIDSIMEHMGDSATCEFNDTMTSCVVGGFDTEEAVKNTLKQLATHKEIRAIQCDTPTTTTRGPQPNSRTHAPDVAREKGEASSSSKAHTGAGMIQKESQRTANLEGEVDILKKDVEQVKETTGHISRRLDGMQNSLEQMEVSRTQDSNILAMMARHFNLDGQGKAEEKKSTPRGAEFKAPDPTTIPATPSAKGTGAQSQRNTDPILETPVRDLMHDAYDVDNMGTDTNTRGGKGTEPSPLKIDSMGQALMEGKRGWLHGPPKTGINESVEWAVVSSMLTAQVAPKRWWAVHVEKLEMAPTLMDAEDFYLDREESDSALARKMGGKRSRRDTP